MKSNLKKINKYLKRAYQQDQKNYSHEKRRCRKEYADWADDEFNMLDNKFIWGINLVHLDKETSFYTWNDAYIYYNRKDKLYYMEVDTTLFELYCKEEDTKVVAQKELDHLNKIDEAFRNFLVENNLRQHAENLSFWYLDLKAETLTQLYTRWRTLLEGYKWYLNKGNIEE